jgi:ribose transport system substrate-binding protein
MNGSNHDEFRLFVAVDELRGTVVTPANYQSRIAELFGVPADAAAAIAAEYPLGAYPSAPVALAAAGTAALAISACGSGGGGSSPSSSASKDNSNPALVSVEKTVQAHEKPPSTIGPTQPIGKPIPKGKRLIFINCGAPACALMGQSFKQAGSVLGWNVQEIAAQPTPQAVQAAFTEALRRNPDGVVSTGFAKELYQRQLAELNKRKIPVFSGTGTDPSSYDPSKGITLEPEPPAEVAKATRLLADKTIVDAGGKGEIGSVLLTGFPIVKLYTEAYENEIKAKCPDCSVKRLTVDPTSIGKDAAQKIANFLRSNPNVAHLFLSYDALGLGLPAAVKGTGGQMPKTYSWAPDQPGVKALQGGERTASVPLGYNEIAWQWADGFARIFTGESVREDGKWGGYVLWSKDYNNVPQDANNPPYIPDYQQQFKKLWGM